VTALIRLRDASVQMGADGRSLRKARPGQASALIGIHLQIQAGERVALVGSNGSGKSTLLRLLHGLLAPTQGEREAAPSLRPAMLFQRPHMLRTTVQRSVALALWLRGTPWGQAQVQALAALRAAGLQDLAGRSARTLSLGQQQQVALARAWALAPQLLLLDEPTASLDPHAKAEVEAMMQHFASSRDDATLVFASHNLGQVKRLAQRVIYLERGQLLADLPVGQFFDTAVLQAQCPAAHLFVKGELA
jgi:tungstate transport system ATP-binding protein